MGTRQRLLVVADGSAAEQVVGEIAARQAEELPLVHLVVPAIPPRGGWTYTEGGAEAAARGRLQKMLGWLRDRGLVVSGEVGDPDPRTAIGDAVRRQRYDGVLVARRPSILSRLRAAVVA